MRRRTAAASVLAAALLGAGCGGQQSEQPQAQPERTVVAKAVEPPPLDEEPSLPESPPESELPDGEDLPAADPAAEAEPAAKPKRRSRAILSPADRESFNALARRLGGQHAIAVSGIGRGRKVERAGSPNNVIAWSTAKIPVAMAVIDAGGQDSQSQNVSAAITVSDNAAAEALWASLGSPEQAASAATGALRQAGDDRTVVESRRLRAGLTAFGQTAWALTDQTRFTAGMPCTASGQIVLGLMGQVTGSQRWGLGAAQGAQFKGGWGPGSQPGQAGGYLDRQTGIVNVDGKPLAVSIASLPADGSHESGTRALTQIMRWLVSHANVNAQPAQAAC